MLKIRLIRESVIGLKPVTDGTIMGYIARKPKVGESITVFQDLHTSNYIRTSQVKSVSRNTIITQNSVYRYHLEED